MLYSPIAKFYQSRIRDEVVPWVRDRIASIATQATRDELERRVWNELNPRISMGDEAAHSATQDLQNMLNDQRVSEAFYMSLLATCYVHFAGLPEADRFLRELRNQGPTR